MSFRRLHPRAKLHILTSIQTTRPNGACAAITSCPRQLDVQTSGVSASDHFPVWIDLVPVR